MKEIILGLPEAVRSLVILRKINVILSGLLNFIVDFLFGDHGANCFSFVLGL
jgi:hypothetical protein